jgi:hypothetical protein
MMANGRLGGEERRTERRNKNGGTDRKNKTSREAGGEALTPPPVHAKVQPETALVVDKFWREKKRKKERNK